MWREERKIVHKNWKIYRSHNIDLLKFDKQYLFPIAAVKKLPQNLWLKIIQVYYLKLFRSGVSQG